MSKSYLNRPELPRGIRNNNPGNLILTGINWQGKISRQNNTDTGKKFEQFTFVKFGIRAKLRDLLTDINKGLNTIDKLIYEYAPPNENDTIAYTNFIKNHTGLSNVNLTQINRSQLVELSFYIMIYENGWILKDYISKNDIHDAIDILGTTNKWQNLKLDLKKTTSQKIISNLPAIGLTLLAFFL